MKKTLILILFFYTISLFQTSFLIHFSILRSLPNLILISVILMNFLEEPKEDSAIPSAVIGGFFWDIFSERPIGFGILILLGVTLLLKLILRKYVRIPTLERF